MNRKLTVALAVVLVLVLAASCTILLTTDQRIRDLQAQVDRYKPYYTSTLAATYGENGVVLARDILDSYDETAALYAQYGIDVNTYGWNTQIKTELLHSKTEAAILYDKAVEMGLDKLSDEENAVIDATVNSAWESRVTEYAERVNPGQPVSDMIRAEAEIYWAQHGFTKNAYAENLRHDTVLDKLQTEVTKDVTVSDDDVRAKYDSMLESQMNEFNTDPVAFISAVNDGDRILYNPEGYRNVNYILIEFDSEAQHAHDELAATIRSLESELEAARSGSDSTTRSVEEIQSDLDSCSAEMEALYTSVLPTAEKVVTEFKNGTSFPELVQKYYPAALIGDNDKGTKVYPVCSNNEYWESVFTTAAMSIAEPGTISDPIRSEYGFVVIYYDSDRPSSIVEFDSVADQLREEALSAARDSVYKAQIEAWVKAASPVYYYENVGIDSAEAEIYSQESVHDHS